LPKQPKHSERLESCTEQLAWDFCPLGFIPMVQVSHLDRWSFHYYNKREYRDRKWVKDLEAR